MPNRVLSFSASEVTTLWRFTNMLIIIIIDTVGWAVKMVHEMTYCVSGGTLNSTHSPNSVQTESLYLKDTREQWHTIKS